MPVDTDVSKLWTLHDRETVRFNLPPYPLAGLRDPLHLFLDLDAEAVDQTVARLLELRLLMTPPPTRN